MSRAKNKGKWLGRQGRRQNNRRKICLESKNENPSSKHPTKQWHFRTKSLNKGKFRCLSKPSTQGMRFMTQLPLLVLTMSSTDRRLDLLLLRSNNSNSSSNNNHNLNINNKNNNSKNNWNNRRKSMLLLIKTGYSIKKLLIRSLSKAKLIRLLMGEVNE